MLAVMIPGDPCAEQCREAVAPGGRFRNAHGWGFSSTHGSQRGKAREFVFDVQVKGTGARRLKPQRNTDKHR